jgi:hypothetical protein
VEGGEAATPQGPVVVAVGAALVLAVGAAVVVAADVGGLAVDPVPPHAPSIAATMTTTASRRVSMHQFYAL